MMIMRTTMNMQITVTPERIKMIQDYLLSYIGKI